MMKSRKIVIDIAQNEYEALDKLNAEYLLHIIKDGTLLPDGAEILTKKAYSDLCLRASKGSKTGKWILAEMGDTDLYECSLCKTRKTYKPPFCPNCGAKMKGK